MKFLKSFSPNWQNDSVTDNQLKYIQQIIRESDFPLEPFIGKTKGEASEWIEKNKAKVMKFNR